MEFNAECLKELINKVNCKEFAPCNIEFLFVPRTDKEIPKSLLKDGKDQPILKLMVSTTDAKKQMHFIAEILTTSYTKETEDTSTNMVVDPTKIVENMNFFADDEKITIYNGNEKNAIVGNTYKFDFAVMDKRTAKVWTKRIQWIGNNVYMTKSSVKKQDLNAEITVPEREKEQILVILSSDVFKNIIDVMTLSNRNYSEICVTKSGEITIKSGHKSGEKGDINEFIKSCNIKEFNYGADSFTTYIPDELKLVDKMFTKDEVLLHLSENEPAIFTQETTITESGKIRYIIKLYLLLPAPKFETEKKDKQIKKKDQGSE